MKCPSAGPITAQRKSQHFFVFVAPICQHNQRHRHSFPGSMKGSNDGFGSGGGSASGGGQVLRVEGTNVVRVPFGVRRARRARPQRPDHWATLVLPFQGHRDPTPPPQAA
jgi:hypothetical protein